MNEENPCESLARRIADIFREGLSPDADVMHYIRSVCSDPSIPELAEILADEDNADNAPLLELIFFPDENMQVRLEDILEKRSFATADTRKVSKHLSRRISEVPLLFPSGDRLMVSLPFWTAEGFVRRLNISRNPDSRMLQAIETHIAADQRRLFKVRLRNSRFVQNERNIFFVCNFLETIGAAGADIPGLFVYILNFLNEISESGQIFTALMDKKKSCFRCMQQTVRFEEQLKSGNMEILMLRGVRSPQMSVEAALKEMAVIDRIAHAVFGRSEHIEVPEFVSSDVSGTDTFDIAFQ